MIWGRQELLQKILRYNIQFLFVFEQCIPLCFENLILVKLLQQI